MPNLFWCALMSKEKGDDYIQDGLIYKGVPLQSSPISIELPNGEFTVDIVSELIALPESDYGKMFIMRNSNPSDYTNEFGGLRKDGLILYNTNSDTFAIVNRPQGIAELGDKRTITFVFDKDNLKSFYFKGGFVANKQANSSFSRKNYNNVFVVNNDIYYKYFGIRIYDRALTPEEIQHNYEIDKERYRI